MHQNIFYTPPATYRITIITNKHITTNTAPNIQKNNSSHYLPQLNPCSAETVSPKVKIARISCSSPGQAIDIKSSIINVLLLREDTEFKVYFEPPEEPLSGLKALIQAVSNPTVLLLYAKPIDQHKPLEIRLSQDDKVSIRHHILNKLQSIETPPQPILIQLLIESIIFDPLSDPEIVLTDYKINTKDNHILLLKFIYTNYSTPYDSTTIKLIQFLVSKIIDTSHIPIDKDPSCRPLILHSIRHNILNAEQASIHCPHTYLQFLLETPDLIQKKVNELYRSSHHAQISFICEHIEQKSFLHCHILRDIFKEMIDSFSDPKKIELLDTLIHDVTNISMLINNDPQYKAHFEKTKINFIESLFSMDTLSTFFKLKTSPLRSPSDDTLTQLNINMISNVSSEDIIIWISCGLTQNAWPQLHTLYCYQEKEIPHDLLALLHNSIEDHCRDHHITEFKADLNISRHIAIPSKWYRDNAYLIYRLPLPKTFK